jgi:hypothetical protein
VFRRLKQKIEQKAMQDDLRKMAGSRDHAQDELEASRLLELIKIQQRAYALTSGVAETSYI